MNSTFRARWLASSEVISQGLFTSEQPKKNKIASRFASVSLLAEVSHDEAKWNEGRETSAGFRRVSYHACARVSLTTSDVFVTCYTTQRTGLNLSASASGCWIWARAQILNGPISVEVETTLLATVVADPMKRGKPKRRILRQIFLSSRVFRPSKHTYLKWNLLGFMELLVLLRFGTFFLRRKRLVEWRLASDGWSGFPANRGL